MKKLMLILAMSALPLPAGAASPSPSPSEAPLPRPTAGEVRINEFLPNPDGSDTGSEWVELKNVGTRTVEIGELRIKRQSGTTVATVPSGITLAGGATYLLDVSGSLVNGGDTIGLWDDSVLIDQVTYDTAEDGLAWVRLGTGEGAWSDAPTPGAENPSTISSGSTGPDVDASTEPTNASTRSAAAGNSTVARRTAAAGAKRGPLPKSGVGTWAYVLPALLATLYAYKTGT